MHFVVCTKPKYFWVKYTGMYCVLCTKPLYLWVEYPTMKMNINKMEISFPTQLFIDGEFCNATNNKKLRSINPHDESLICEVLIAQVYFILLSTILLNCPYMIIIILLLLLFLFLFSLFLIIIYIIRCTNIK